MKHVIMGDGGKAQGSISVFMTLIFGVILAVVTATFENVRFVTVDSYMMAAAEAAAMSVFGEYNQELYQEYGLFGYGGYEGHGVTELSKVFLDSVSYNLATRPEAGDSSDIIQQRMDYTSLYRIGNVSNELSDIENLTNATVFYQQVEAFLKTQVIDDITEEIAGIYHNITKQGEQETIQQDLNITSEYEHGNYEMPDEVRKDIEKDKDAAKDMGSSTTAEQVAENPLETFRELLRDGVLNLVCDTDQLSEETIEAAYTQPKQETVSSNKIGNSTADLLKDLLKDDEGIMADSFLDTTKEKGELICYAQQVLSQYTHRKEKTFQYGIEYLISGSAQERDNLLNVISWLFVIRTAINYAYVHADASLQAASLATATEIAGALGVPPLISAIQQTILIILSAEESCVDITALLEGKMVPVFKDAINFQMKYAEICGVSKAMFQKKAKKYSAGKGKWSAGSLNYQQYLWIFMLLVPEQQLRLRTCDLIQNDLQKRCNPTFSLEQCISGMRYQIGYDMPFLWSGLLPGGQKNGIISKQTSGWYRYQ